MRQISIPLVFLEYNFFHIEKWFLQAHLILEKLQNHILVQNKTGTSSSTLVTNSNGILTKINMEKTAVASK